LCRLLIQLAPGFSIRPQRPTPSTRPDWLHRHHTFPLDWPTSTSNHHLQTRNTHSTHPLLLRLAIRPPQNSQAALVTPYPLQSLNLLINCLRNLTARNIISNPNYNTPYSVQYPETSRSCEYGRRSYGTLARSTSPTCAGY
jgi:hypothetical protein